MYDRNRNLENQILELYVKYEELQKENINMKYDYGKVVRLSQNLLNGVLFLHAKTDYKRSILKEIMINIMYYAQSKAHEYKYKHDDDSL